MTEKYNPFKRIEKERKRFSKMSLKEAQEIVGNRDTWELKNMRKALSSIPLLNTTEDNQMLEAVKKVLRNKNKKWQKK